MTSAKQPEIDLRRRDALQALGAGAVAASIGGTAFAGANGSPEFAGSGVEATRSAGGPYKFSSFSPIRSAISVPVSCPRTIGYPRTSASRSRAKRKSEKTSARCCRAVQMVAGS